jgi:hypothetical protein
MVGLDEIQRQMDADWEALLERCRPGERALKG